MLLSIDFSIFYNIETVISKILAGLAPFAQVHLPELNPGYGAVLPLVSVLLLIHDPSEKLHWPPYVNCSDISCKIGATGAVVPCGVARRGLAYHHAK